MSDKYNWPEVQLYIEANKGLAALEKLTGEKPTIYLNKEALAKWETTTKMTEEFYRLDIQERLYVSGVSTRPEAKS